jgi:hypothetical protein
MEKTMTREDVITAIKKATEELGHVPSLNELAGTGRVSNHSIRRHFGQYLRALDACGLERNGHGYKLSPKALFEDWMRLARQLGKIPSIIDYDAHGRYSVTPYVRQFGGWLNVPAGIWRYAEMQHMKEEWKDELDMVAAHLQTTPKSTQNPTWISSSVCTPRIRPEEPVYGPPVAPFELLLSPMNEQGVVFLFGAMAKKLGFAITQIQAAFPDCEAYREIEPGKWQRVRIEFEYESRNFREHMHDPEKCHLIVCWSHNWEGCPLEVVELKKEIAKIAGSGN